MVIGLSLWWFSISADSGHRSLQAFGLRAGASYSTTKTARRRQPEGIDGRQPRLEVKRKETEGRLAEMCLSEEEWPNELGCFLCLLMLVDNYRLLSANDSFFANVDLFDIGL